MPKSASGTLRMGIGPRQQRLRDTNAIAKRLLDGQIPTEQAAQQQYVSELQKAIDKLRPQIDTLVEKEEQFRQLILQIDDETEAAAEEVLFQQTVYDKAGFAWTVDEAKELVNMLQTRKAEADVPVSIPPTGSVPQNGSDRNRQSAKLPKLQLPTFDGDHLQWPQFWQIFQMNVHNTRLSNAEKFAYLRAQLRGVAYNAIGDILVDDGNYDLAIDILREKFERPPEQRISNYYGELKKLAQSSERLSDLKKTFDLIEQILRQLAAAGENVDSSKSLVLDVLNKYPQHVVELLFRDQKISATSTLGDVRKALKGYIKMKEGLSEMLEDLSVAANSKTVRPKSEDAVANRESPRPLQLSSTLAAGDAPPRPKEGRRPPMEFISSSNRANLSRPRVLVKPENPCYFCQGGHFNADCPKYTSAEERAERLEALGRCKKCMLKSHETWPCFLSNDQIRCFFCRSSGEHRTAMCPQQFKGKSPNQQAGSEAEAQGAQSTKKTTLTAGSALLSVAEQSVLMTAVTSASKPGQVKTRKVRIILDTASHRSYITEACARDLDLEAAHHETIGVAIFGTKRSLSVASQRVQCDIRLRDGRLKTISVNTTPLITDNLILPKQLPRSAQQLVDSMPYALADDYDSEVGQIDILIGSDYFWEIVVGSPLPASDGLFVIPSSLGLLLAGRYSGDQVDQPQPTLLCLTESTNRIGVSELGLVAHETKRVQGYPDIDEFWQLETVGISDDPVENDDAKALQQFNDSVRLQHNRYEVKWPWKDDASDLPTNYALALGRLRSLAKRLGTTEAAIGEQYQRVIDDQLEKGIIEKVDPKKQAAARLHYLPHHPVVRMASATTQVRIVYDASAKVRKDARSLNECLYRGPVLLPHLCAILVRFRTYPIAMVADIEKAFLQMGLQLEDRDVTRFLWFADPKRLEVENNVAEYRFCRVPFGVISSPFLLEATIQYHMNCTGTPVAKLISDNIYVDNVICGTNSDDEAVAFYHGAKKIFQAASMNLTEWCANSETFISSIPPGDLTKQRENKVLGLSWDSIGDTLQLRKPAGLDVTESSLTKRQTLKLVAAVYDPLGLFQPSTLKAKCFLRDLWERDKSWDEPLDSDLCQRWETIRNDLGGIFLKKIDRFAGKITDDSILAVFCDASADAYAAAVYLRTTTTTGCKTDLVYSKSRLSPKNRSEDIKVSIPRLELLGVTIGVKAASFVSESLMRSDPNLRL